MCGTKGSTSTSAGTSTGSSTTTFAQGPTQETGKRYETFLDKVTGLAGTEFNPSTLSDVAPLTDKQKAAIEQMYTLGSEMGEFDPAAVQEIMSPYTQEVVNKTQDWFNNTNAIQGDLLMGDAIKKGNAFGGDRAGVAEAQLAGQQKLAQDPVIAGLYEKGYTAALEEYNKLKEYGIKGAEEAVKAGTVEQAQTQRELDVATANAQQEEAYKFQIANWEGAALGGIGPLTGTVGAAQTDQQSSTTGESTPASGNPLTQALGAVSTVTGLANAIGSGGSSSGTTSGTRVERRVAVAAHKLLLQTTPPTLLLLRMVAALVLPDMRRVGPLTMRVCSIAAMAVALAVMAMATPLIWRWMTASVI